jgi:outer membrane protein X
MKKSILVMALLLFSFISYSQREGAFRVGMDLGFVPASGGAGISYYIEPKYNIKENMNIGFRIGGAAIARDVEDFGSSTFVTATGIGSYLGTFDYYFPNGKSFVPFVGGGLGYVGALSVRADEDIDVSGQSVTGGFGGVIRGGFEWGKFRMGLEYNLVPKSKLYYGTIESNEDISNSYFAITLGFYVGGGKWGK